MLEQFKNKVAQLLAQKNPRVIADAPLFLELLSTHAFSATPLILICKDPESLSKRIANLKALGLTNEAELKSFKSDNQTFYHAAASDPYLRMARCANIFSFGQEQFPRVLVFDYRSLMEKSAPLKTMQEYAQLIACNEKIVRDELISNLHRLGYSLVDQVLDRGTFAVRGSIIDVFINGEKLPIRIDLFGDEVESIKLFDPDTQRSLGTRDWIAIGPVREIIFDEENKARAQQKLCDLADHINFPTRKLNEKLSDIENEMIFFGIEKLKPAFFEQLQNPLEIILENFSDKRLPTIVFEDKTDILAQCDSFFKKISDLHQKSLLKNELLFAPDDYYSNRSQLETLLTRFDHQIDIVSGFSENHNEGSQSFKCQDVKDIRHDILQTSIRSDHDHTQLFLPLANKLKQLRNDQITPFIFLSKREHETQLRNFLTPLSINLQSVKEFSYDSVWQPHVHANIVITKNPLRFGAIFSFLKIALISEDDIFGERTKRNDKSGKQKGFATSLSEIDPGDYVVHVDHGLGQFDGLKRLTMRGVASDYISIIYAKNEKLYLPTHKINLIKPYGFAQGKAARLDRLGTSGWQSKKKKVSQAVMAMAQDLLRLYAKRELVKRPPFLAPDSHFFEFESSFPFEPTIDQQKAFNDVLSDMQKDRPMDRLVCGDVGYGKTEVAMRASMLAVASQRQVAVLSPTTVLAQQHGITFKERFKNTGVIIEVISRFQKRSEIKNILQRVAEKNVDILIGTHRLLSADVNFKDLGLIIIDEEQRFGIKAKEHLKSMRTKADVLAMSATPIPRTMQMGLFGIRDLSIIETPPVDRRAIQTQIAQFDDALIKEAIKRELSRGGQIYFVHNRVQSINTLAKYLEELVPNARIAVAHGQMSESDLEEKMLAFMEHSINILVCTTIIETGIDVPSANTMFINNADDFGLSQLYQLRGRIGRSKERAFAYLLIKSQKEQLSPLAKSRLEILHRFSELGAGFRIAQHDLELRGAGDLLGKNQHGQMAAVGYDLYAELLKNAVASLKGQKANLQEIEPEIILPISALIPDKYCPDLHERMGYYQKFASATQEEEISELFFELEDLYGQAPSELIALKTSSLIKIWLRKIHATKLEISNNVNDEKLFNISIELSKHTPLCDKKLHQAVTEKTLRITPQQKIIQTLGKTETDPAGALEQAAKSAIEKITIALLIPEELDNNR